MLTEPFTGELTEQLCMRPSRERRRPRDEHVIHSSTLEFLFEFQNLNFLEYFIRISSCPNIKPFEVRGSTVKDISIRLLMKKVAA
jgi:hypothetical protein